MSHSSLHGSSKFMTHLLSVNAATTPNETVFLAAPQRLNASNTCTQQHIMSSGVPAQDSNTFGVAFQLDNRICE